MKEVSTEKRASEFNALFQRKYASTIFVNTIAPSSSPSDAPSVLSLETDMPTFEPSEIFTNTPTYEPSEISSETPTFEPSEISSETPTYEPSEISSETPTFEPSEISSETPTYEPSEISSDTPTYEPSQLLTEVPTFAPSRSPSSTPSVRPYGNPSAVPSSFPTSGPTYIPFSQPSTLPSSHPFSSPSSRPTLLPTTCPAAVPSSRPSVSPSTGPTFLPSIRSSSRPSLRPSSAPSERPSGDPSGIPISHPSETPSGHPTFIPSSRPYEDPTLRPSSTPSYCPHGNPSNPPSSHASFTSSVKPTFVPSTRPSSGPSLIPSSAPSQGPSGNPSDIPVPHPSSTPSVKPTFSPFTLPSADPSLKPFSAPSERPNGIPSSIPSSYPSVIPSVNPVFVPFSHPSEAPVATPFSAPSSIPSFYPFGDVPSGFPSSVPGSLPTLPPSCSHITSPSSVPSDVPLSRPTSVPTALPEFNFTSFYFTHPPNITSIDLYHTSLVGSTASAEVAVVLSNSFGGTLYCLASQSSFLQVSSISSTDIFFSQGIKKVAHSNVVIVSLANLIPSTNYTVLCSTKSLSGISLSLPLSLSQNAKFETSCCKTISVSLSFLTVYEFSNTLNAVNIKISSSPSTTLKAELLLISDSDSSSTSSSTVLVASNLYPTQFSIASSSSALTSTFSAGTPGNYRILLSISGSASREFSVTYTTSNVVKVISALTEPPTPSFQTATFSNDGSYIIVTFDQPTNMGGYSNSFPCSSLFSFLGIASSTCLWKDTSNINIYQSASSSANSLDIGKNITLLSTAILKAYCPSSITSQLCSTWKTIPGKTVKITAPTSVVSPMISVSAPTILAPCQSFTLDLTSSSGNAGRSWKSMIFTISQFPKVSSVQPLYNYLVKNYTYSPPGVIPSTLLSRGTTYTIGVTLCNFLQACSTKSASITIMKNETLIPVVSIKGATSISTYRSYPLQIKSKAYTESCTGETPFSNLKYSWKLTFLSSTIASSSNITEGMMKRITSTSQNPAYFSLAGYTLPAGAVYQLIVSVTSSLSNEVSTSPVIITVQQGALIAVINGGSNKIIQTNVVSTIDGSNSYDQDVNGLTGTLAGFSYSWDCYQLKPAFQSNCSNSLLFIGSTTSQKLQISPVNDLAINSTSQVTMTIYDNTRTASATMSVFITTKDINSITITTSQQQLTSISTSNNVIISSTMKIVSSCTAIWSINDASLTLASIAGTTIQQAFKTGASFQPFNLLIKADTFPQRASLLLTLTCGLGTSSVQLTTNGAPLPGSFSSNPTSGDELSTSFVLFADSWSDSDLPITYQFGFISPSTGAKMVVLGRSSGISTSTVLPAGHEASQFAVTCSLQVYDVFNASTTSSLVVAVHPISGAQQQTQLINLLASSTSSSLDVDSQKALISVVSSVINRINCTVPINCSTLHRSGCLNTPNTCGTCLSGYTGDSGDRNTKCVDLSSFSAPSLSSTVCIIDANCSNSLQSCINATCVYSPKTCPNDCSGSGTCLFRSVSTGVSVSDCRLNDASCESFCHCNDGFYGSSCSLNEAELVAIQAVRSALVNTLQNLTQSDDINSESVSSWADYLSAISNNPYEIPESDLATVGNIALTTMSAAETLGLVWSKVAGLLDTLDGITTVSNDYTERRRRRRRLDTSSSTSGNEENLITVLSKFANIVSNNKVYGDNDESHIKTNFRILSSSSLFSNNRNITVSVASTAFEELLEVSKSSLTLLPNVNSSLLSNTFVTSLIQTYQKSYSSGNLSSAFYSNPIRLQLKSSSIESNEFSSLLLSGIYVTLQHTSSVDNFIFGNLTKSNFTTICSKEIKTESHICSYSNKVITHHCNSSFIGTFTSICPIVQPSCNNLNVITSTISTTNCQVMNYTTSTTVCFCQFSPSTNSTTRRTLLSDSTSTAILDDTGTATLVAATTYLGEDFYTTFTSANALNESNGFEKSIVVAVLVMIIWGGGFCLLFIIHFREISLIQSNEKYSKLLNMKKEYEKMIRNDDNVNEQVELASLMKEQILSYIDMIMPAVYNTKETFLQRSFRELGLHHRYFHLFIPDTRRANLYDRFYRTMKILSIQTLTMFLQALLFDLQNPIDDNTCQSYQNESLCLQRKTIFDSEQTYCSWNNVNEKCSYANPSFSEIAVIYVMIITAICTTIFKVPLDQLLKIWICPVAPDGKKANIAVVPSMETPNVSPVNDNRTKEEQNSNVSRFLSSDKSNNSNRKTNAMILSTVTTGKDGTLIQLGNHLDRLKEDRAIPFEVMIAQEKTIQNLSLIDDYLNKMNNNNASKVEGLTLKDIREGGRGGGSGSSFIDPLSSLKGHNATSTSMYHIRSFYSLPNLKPEERGESGLVTSDHNHNDEQHIYQVPSNDLERSIEEGHHHNHHHHRLGGNNADEREASAVNLLVNSFCSDILQYKVELVRKNMKTTNVSVATKKIELFNEQWGMYPSTDLSDIAIKPYKECFLPGVLTTFSTVFQSNLKYFQKISSVFLLLHHTSCGIELMHYFIIDLLGQQTKAALIFRNKFNEDFEKLKIVSKYLKYFAILIVFGLNAFFIYYLLLRAITKGYSWQLQYLQVVITQMLIEIFLFESIEVIWLHLITPESVKPEVKKVIFILELLANNIEKLILSSSLTKKMEEPYYDNTSPNTNGNNPSLVTSSVREPFDSTSYLFLSKQLAELRPQLIESKIIQTYHNSFPGNICHLWPHYRKILKEKKKHHHFRVTAAGNTSKSSSASPVNRSFHKSVLSSNSADTIEEEGGVGEGINSSKLNRLFNGTSHIRNQGNLLFIMISSIASGILFTFQNFGILPFLYQRFIIRITQTSFLSGLTLIWYTAMKNKAYFALFVIIVFLFLCIMMIRSYFLKTSESTITNVMKSVTFLRNASSYKLRNSSKSGYQSKKKEDDAEEDGREGDYPFAMDSSSQSEDVYDFESIDLNELDKRIQGKDRIKPSEERVTGGYHNNREDQVIGPLIADQIEIQGEKEERENDLADDIDNDFDDVLLNGEMDDLIASNIISQQERQLLMNLRNSRSSKKGNKNQSQQQRQIILPKQLSGPLSPLNQPASPFSDYSPVNHDRSAPLVERNSDAFIDPSLIYPDKDEKIPSHVFRHQHPLQHISAKEENLRPMSSPVGVTAPLPSALMNNEKEGEDCDISSPYSQRLPTSPKEDGTIKYDEMFANPMKRSSPLYARNDLCKVPNNNKGKDGFKLTKFPFSPENSLNIEINDHLDDGKEDSFHDSHDEYRISGGRLLNASKKQAEAEGDISDSSSDSSDSYGVGKKSLMDNTSMVDEAEGTNEFSERSDSPVVTRHSKKRGSPLGTKSHRQKPLSTQNVDESAEDNKEVKKISFTFPKKTLSHGASSSQNLLPSVGASLLRSYSEDQILSPSGAAFRSLMTLDHPSTEFQAPPIPSSVIQSDKNTADRLKETR
jgi:hypothetical protein